MKKVIVFSILTILLVIISIALTARHFQLKEKYSLANQPSQSNQLSQKSTFDLKEKCFSYKEDLEKAVAIFNTKQKEEPLGDNDGTVSYCLQHKKFTEVFYSVRRNSCLNTEIVQTYCRPDPESRYHLAYEYHNLLDVLTGKMIEEFKTISRSEYFQSEISFQELVNGYR